MLGRARLGLVLGLLTAFPAAAQDLQKGTAAYARGDYATALREVGPLAVAGDAGAQNNLGLMYLKGNGVPQDYGEAIFWFREAAEQGHPRAQYNLAVMYLKGDGVPRNIVRSMAWFREAAARGHIGARNALALFHSKPPEAASAPEKTKAPAKPATEASQVAARGAFRIQLGAVRSQSVAAQEAERLNRVHGPVLGDVRIVPVRADLGERGVFWRLRAGSFNDGAAAKALCGRLAERNQACIVVRN